MIDLSELIDDEDFCQEFVIIRMSGNYQNGRFVKEETQIPVVGIAVSRGKDLDMQAESDRANNIMSFHTKEEFRVSPDDTLSDVILLKGKRYKLFQVSDFSANGFYSALGKEV